MMLLLYNLSSFFKTRLQFKMYMVSMLAFEHNSHRVFALAGAVVGILQGLISASLSFASPSFNKFLKVLWYIQLLSI